MSMIYDYDSVNLNLCLWFQPAQVGLFQQVVGQHLLAWPGLSQEAYKWLIQNPFQCHPMAEELVIILWTSPDIAPSYLVLSVSIRWIWLDMKHPFNFEQRYHCENIPCGTLDPSWIAQSSPQCFQKHHGQVFSMDKTMRGNEIYRLLFSAAQQTSGSQIYTDLHRSTQTLPWPPWLLFLGKCPSESAISRTVKARCQAPLRRQGGHDFPWRNAWRLKDSLKERLSKAMSLPSSLTLCSDSLKLSQTQMSFRDFTRKVFGKANFSLLRVKQMRLHVPFWTWRGKHSHLIMAKFLERSKYWPDISATDFVQEGNCLKPGASSLTLIGHLIQDCLPSWRLDFVKDIQAEGPVSSTTTCSQEPGAVHTAWQILQTSASQGIQ